MLSRAHIETSTVFAKSLTTWPSIFRIIEAEQRVDFCFLELSRACVVRRTKYRVSAMLPNLFTLSRATYRVGFAFAEHV